MLSSKSENEIQRDKGRFVTGQKSFFDGMHHSEETKQKIRNKKKGKRVSTHTEFKKGCVPWNKGLSKLTDKRVLKNSIATRNSVIKLFEQDPTYRIRISAATRKAMRNVQRTTLSPWKGKKNSQHSDYMKRISTRLYLIGLWSHLHSGSLSPNWKNAKGGYPLIFKQILRIQARIRDNFTCQDCGQTENELGYTLSVHHIDEDKQNILLSNLISLCRRCHGKRKRRKK